MLDTPLSLGYDMLVTDQEKIEQLERQVRELNRALVGVQEILRKAGNFKHDNLETRLDGIQFLLVKAAEYTPREQKKGRR